jgi:sulfhydrogenase subunit beta (sulfur reductase)
MCTIESSDFQYIIASLVSRGYTVIGPVVRDDAIVLDEIRDLADLPKNVGDRQEPSRYSLRQREDGAYFGFGIGPVSWKKFFFPPMVTLFRAHRSGKTFSVDRVRDEKPPGKLALIGVRACELNAIAIQDRIFREQVYSDPVYADLRQNTFVVAVHCTAPSDTCFCTSMGTGPKADHGFDLAVTELPGNGRHVFVVETGSNSGNAVLAEVPHRETSEEERRAAEAAIEHAAASMKRRMVTDGLPQILRENLEWDAVAKRCLACANCTMACPTCFCSTVEDFTDLTGAFAERRRRWDSCFTQDFSRVAGGNTRPSTRARYRQWLTHKLAHWVDQFGTMGCVGCGRCITWCPAGIDLTEEVNVIRGNNTHA